MKTYLIALGALFAGALHAQDPKITSPTVAPSPGLVNGPVTASVGFENNSTTAIPYDVNNPTYISFTLVKITPTLDGSGVPAVTGAGADFFTWTATQEANNTWTILGIQKQDIPGMPDPFTTIGGPISISGKINAASTPAEAAANNGDGFNANIIPAAGYDVDNSSESNNQSVYGSTDGVMPVKLRSFEASQEGAQALLSWVTTEEENAGFFEIERSGDGKGWQQIGTKAAAGESIVLLSYQYTDVAPLTGVNYYRLKMVDNDMTFAYSKIAKVTFDDEGSVMLYPNPVTDVLKIKSKKQIGEVAIFSQSGEKRFTSKSYDKGGIDVSGFDTGLYLVRFKDKSGSLYIRKVLIKH